MFGYDVIGQLTVRHPGHSGRGLHGPGMEIVADATGDELAVEQATRSRSTANAALLAATTSGAMTTARCSTT